MQVWMIWGGHIDDRRMGCRQGGDTWSGQERWERWETAETAEMGQTKDEEDSRDSRDGRDGRNSAGDELGERVTLG
jgi:hypothetical protein